MSRKIALVIGVTLVAASFSIAAYASTGPIMGPTARVTRPAFHGYYDGHKNTYLNTDLSSKADAAAMHINYSASIGKVKGLPEIYLVEGRAAPGQLAIFGSEPGEKNYSPLWSETILTWKAGAHTTAPEILFAAGICAREGGAFMEPSGRNQWQPMANGKAPETAQTSRNRCHRLRPVATGVGW
jgi:hypothetical protein